MKYAAFIEQQFDVIGRSGDEYTCHCRWCDSSKNVLYANAVRGLYVCFTCGAKGRLDALGPAPEQTTEGLRDRLRRVKEAEKPPTFYPEGWLKQFDVPTSYWTQQRGLSPEIVEKFGLGYDPFSNRVTLPLRDVQGRILGVTYRRLDDGKPKYLHPKGFPIGRHLYGAWLLSDQRKVAVVEGQVDTIACWNARVPAVGLMGSRMTMDQVRVLQRLGVTKVALMLDNDRAGLLGTIGVHEALKGSGIQVTAGWYRDYWTGAKDPDGLKPDRLRKMFHSSVAMRDWATRIGLDLT